VTSHNQVELMDVELLKCSLCQNWGYEGLSK